MSNHDVDVHEQTYHLIEKGFSTTIVCEVNHSDPINISDSLTLKEYTPEGSTGRQIRVRVVNIDEHAHGVTDGFCLVTFFYKALTQRIQHDLIDCLNNPDEHEDEKEMCLDYCMEIIRLLLNNGLLPDILETCADYTGSINQENSRSEKISFSGPIEKILTQCAAYVKGKNYNTQIYNILDIDN